MRKVWRGMGGLAALGVVTLGLAACEPALEAPGKTGDIRLVDTATVDGWRFETFVNDAYPCAVSGYQTFAVGTKVGSSPTAASPLWVRMRGGGVGWFDSNGVAQPSEVNKKQEGPAKLRERLLKDDIMGLVREDAAGFRLLSVSMCGHDIYGGGDTDDPDNPNLLPDGSPRTVNGLFATKAAVEFASERYPTSDSVLHGTSAGGYGAFHVAWALQEQGLAPAGIISDSGVLNRDWQLASVEQGLCPNAGDEEGLLAVERRLHSAVRNPDNEPHEVVGRGELTVPVFHVWSSGDFAQCGQAPMDCPLPDGSTVTLGAVDCLHEPLARAIDAQGPSSRSSNMRLCVEGAEPGPCDMHTPTAKVGAVNTDPAFPADFQPVVMDWVLARLEDA